MLFRGKYSKEIVTVLGAFVVYMVSITLFAYYFRGESVFATLMWSLAVLTIPLCAYEQTSTKTVSGRWMIYGLAFLLSVGDILNIFYFTTFSGGTVENPVLNNSDASINFYVAKEFYEKEMFALPIAIKTLFRWLICQVWRVMGVSVAVPIFINSIFILLAIILSGLITRNVLKTTDKKVVFKAMALTASVCYFLNSGTLLLKDAGVCFAVCLIAYAFTSIRNLPSKKMDWLRVYLFFFVGELMLVFFRVNLLLPVMMGALFVTPWLTKKCWHGALFLVLSAIIWFSADWLFPTGSISFRVTTYVDGYGFGTAYFQEHSSRALYNSIYGNDYFFLPIWKKLLYAPLSALIQFITPFPWNFSRDTVFGPTLAYAHFSYPWYFVGGLIVWFILFGWNKVDKSVRVWALWGIAFWLVPVYMFGGSVSRYGLPAIPLLMPLAVTALSFRKRKSFKIYSICYLSLLACVLVVAYYLQNFR